MYEKKKTEVEANNGIWPVWLSDVDFCLVLQAQLQRSLDSSVSTQPRALIGRRSRKEAAAAIASGTDSDGQGGSPVSEQDSGILDVEDEEEDDEVRKLHAQTH